MGKSLSKGNKLSHQGVPHIPAKDMGQVGSASRRQTDMLTETDRDRATETEIGRQRQKKRDRET